MLRPPAHVSHPVLAQEGRQVELLRARERTALTKPDFPLWAFITEMVAIPMAFVLFGLLSRRLRLSHPDIWEKLGRPRLFIWTWPGSILALLDRFDANFRLFAFPFRTASFQLEDTWAATLLWLVRAISGLVVILRAWSVWANS
jgi:hypothetical protein